MPPPDFRTFSDIVTSATLIKEIFNARIHIRKYKIELIDDTILHVKEVVIFSENKVDYAYQWQKLDSTLIIRWDNAHDYPFIETSPFHKHVHTESNVLPSEPMTLEKVLGVIKARIIIP